MASAAPRTRLSPPTPAIQPHRKRARSPPASGPVVWRSSSSGNGAPRDHRRRWQSSAGAPGRVYERHRPQQYGVPSRRWVFAEEASTSDGDACTIMSYNILADTNARYHTDLYLDVPWDAMRWDSRRRLIIREIRHWDPDLEVDRFRDIATEMKNRGLCLLEEDSIDFSEYNLRNNVAQIFVFELNNTQKFVVGNIHVLFNPKRGDVKLGQIRMLLENANAIAEKWGGIPIVLAGDFNTTPDLDISLHDRRQLSGLDGSEYGLYDLCSLLKYQWSGEEVRNATGSSNVMVAKHPLNICSSYAMLKGNSNNRDHQGEPLATSYHKKFLGTVDYLWYTAGLECSRVLDTLPVGFLRRTRGLPTREIGSDHLPIVAEFVFTESAASTDSDEEDESDEDKESEQEATRAQHIYFSSDSDISDEPTHGLLDGANPLNITLV
uniref:Endonuclease/exonuclease/phosphatase domain-containing protein n=1 Tax=Leersia perrieri TaxID=77586 RepID=A0A0D9WP34_9ORYZ